MYRMRRMWDVVSGVGSKRGILAVSGQRGVKTAPGDMRKGDWVVHDERPMIVTGVSSMCSGRGIRSYTIALKCIYSGQLHSVRPVGGDCLDKLDCYDEIYSFLYQEGDVLYLSHPKTLEQIEVHKKVLGAASTDAIQPGSTIKVRFNSEGHIPVHASLKAGLAV